MNDELKSEIQCCRDIAARARELLPKLALKVRFERAAAWLTGCHAIEQLAQQAESAEGEYLASLMMRIGFFAGSLDSQIQDFTDRPKRRAARNKQLKHQAKRLQTAERFDELQREVGRNAALEKLASELKLDATKSVVNRLSTTVSPQERSKLEQLFAEPWFGEFLDLVDGDLSGLWE